MNQLTIEAVAKALIINNRNEVLILTIGEHTKKPEKSFTPDLPGGLVDSGENEHEAVIREINEETGIVIDKSQLAMVYSETNFVDKERKSVSKHLFIVRSDDVFDVTISWEHSAYDWVPLNELTQIEFRPFYKRAIGYCFANGILDYPA